jgi:hypothetical protein
VFLLILSSFLAFYCRAEVKSLVLLIVGMDEIKKTEDIDIISKWYQNQGFAFRSVSGHDFVNSDELKTFLTNEWKINGLVACILPLKTFNEKVSIKIGDEIHTQQSDKFFGNLDNDKNMISEISISRATVAEMSKISKREFPSQLIADFAMPITNFATAACIPGKCLEYKKSDPSYMGQDCKKIFIQKGYKARTYFETEGSMTSAQKPDFSLNYENISNSDANFSFFLDTKEFFITHPEGYALGSDHKEFKRAILRDDNKDGLSNKGEVSLENFYAFSKEEAKMQKIGFLPLFDNEEMNLNGFSSIIGVNNPDFDCFAVYGDGTGLTASMYAVFRLVVENLISGKTIGESIDVFKQYKDKFPLDKYHQEIYALTLFIRGNPLFRLDDFVGKAQLKVIPAGIVDDGIDFAYSSYRTFEFQNIGISNLTWEIVSKPDWIKTEVDKGNMIPDEIIEIKLRVEVVKRFGVLAIPQQHVGLLKIKTNDPKKSWITIKLSARFF